MRKIIVILTVAILLCASLASCASKSGNPAPATASKTEESAASTQKEASSTEEKEAAASTEEKEVAAASDEGAKGEKVEFEFYHGVGGDMSDLLVEIVNDFNTSQEQYSCKPVYYASYSDAFKGFQAAMAAKQPPALLLGGVSVNEGKKGIFADVMPFIKEDADFHIEDYVDAYVSQCMDEDKMYTLPFYGSAWMIFYDKNVFAEKNIDPNAAFATWEDIGETAKTLTQKDANGEITYWGFEPMWGTSILVNAALSNGGKVFSDDGKTIAINSQEWVDSWEMFRKWIHEDKVMTIHHGGQGWEYWYKTMDDVLEGRAAAFTGTAGDLQVLDWDKVNAHLVPGFKGKGPATPLSSCLQVGIAATAPVEQQRAAFALYKFVTSPENGARWSMGTGYIPANKKAIDAPEYVEFLKTAPYMQVAFDTVKSGVAPYIDPTNGKIQDALSKACDKLMIEGISAKEALDEAAATVQSELDSIQ